ncbi:MAG TPA: type I-E CRISPR-associated protein Cas7/Cse4/CasC, partial [Lachnospiraceae bacterium]|nr:type I-E CRISPR-associated protein Cas7/Cse4/CasC [Lachnospiraceae bacterium]
MNNNIYMDLHVIQTVPPSNINRDDTGSPKTAQYGGVTRARVSSQSWKKAMRDYFKEHTDEETLGIRTVKIVNSLAEAIMEKDQSVDEKSAYELAEEIFNTAKISTKDREAKALFFLGGEQRKRLASYGVEHAGNLQRKEIQNILKANQSIDIALFGRMVADAPELNVDASSQVAHSISTHEIATEFDFFTAVDDLTPKDQAGAGMLGTVEYNSSTLYRYANVAVHELN